MSTPTRLSRSARNRAAHKAVRTNTVPKGTVQPRRVQNSPHDLAHNTANTAGIRIVGYLGRNSTKVRYSGSGADGYRSEWTGTTDIFTDHRWDATVSRPIR